MPHEFTPPDPYPVDGVPLPTDVQSLLIEIDAESWVKAGIVAGLSDHTERISEGVRNIANHIAHEARRAEPDQITLDSDIAELLVKYGAFSVSLTNANVVLGTDFWSKEPETPESSMEGTELTAEREAQIRDVQTHRLAEKIVAKILGDLDIVEVLTAGVEEAKLMVKSRAYSDFETAAYYFAHEFEDGRPPRDTATILFRRVLFTYVVCKLAPEPKKPFYANRYAR